MKALILLQDEIVSRVESEEEESKEAKVKASAE